MGKQTRLKELAEKQFRVSNKARLIRNRFKNSSIIFVEGEDDLRLFNKYITQDRCFILPAAGKETVIKIVDELEENKYKGIIAILDADFDNLLEIELSSDNLILTEEHDLEMMIFKVDKIFENIAAEYISREKLTEFIDQFEKDELNYKEKIEFLKRKIFQAGEFIGVVRFWNQNREGKRLRFSGIVFDDFIRLKNYDVDLKDLIMSLNMNSFTKVDQNEVEGGIEKEQDKKYDFWNICSGHDIIDIVLVGVRNIFGYEKKASRANHERMIEFIHASFTDEMFMATELYKKIKNWERITEFRVLKD
ncbi:DUF4435 domain-containing protein [Candidatus Dependentiae bacterium]|nr:DUF4435 domain-containing protein [Candidatus Dependentiae bacterium]